MVVTEALFRDLIPYFQKLQIRYKQKVKAGGAVFQKVADGAGTMCFEVLLFICWMEPLP